MQNYCIRQTKTILHISSNTFHQRKCFHFVIICNLLLFGRPARRSRHLAVYQLVVLMMRAYYIFL